MRIGIDIGKALGVADGIATYSSSLVTALMTHDDGNEYRLYDLHHASLDHDRYHEVFADPPGRFGAAESAPEADGLDLFHVPAHRLPSPLTGGLVYTLHDLTFVSHPRFHTIRNRAETLAATAGAACRGARFLAVSRHTRDQAIELLGLPADRIDVVHSAADSGFRPPDDESRDEVLGRLGIDRPYVLSVGSLEPRKNVTAIVDAFSSLPSRLRDRHALVVTGAEGWRNRAIHRRLERAAREYMVVRTGEVTRDDLVGLYGFAELVVYPSISEGFGLPVLEAMACGTPVVTSDRSSLPEVAGDAALLVDPEDTVAIGDAVRRLLDEPSLRRELGQRGLERAADFSWERTAQKTLEVYRRAASE